MTPVACCVQEEIKQKRTLQKTRQQTTVIG